MDQVAGRDAGRSLKPRCGSGVGRARVDRGRGPRLGFVFAVLFEDFPGAGRVRYAVPIADVVAVFDAIPVVSENVKTVR